VEPFIPPWIASPLSTARLNAIAAPDTAVRKPEMTESENP
jgi:hypothetical protein